MSTRLIEGARSKVPARRPSTCDRVLEIISAITVQSMSTHASRRPPQTRLLHRRDQSLSPRGARARAVLTRPGSSARRAPPPKGKQLRMALPPPPEAPAAPSPSPASTNASTVTSRTPSPSATPATIRRRNRLAWFDGQWCRIILSSRPPCLLFGNRMGGNYAATRSKASTPSLADLEAMRKSGITPIIRKMIDDDDGTSPAAERRERNRPSTAFARSPLAPLMTFPTPTVDLSFGTSGYGQSAVQR